MEKNSIIIYGGSSLISKELLKILSNDYNQFIIFCRKKIIVQQYIDELKLENSNIKLFEVDLDGNIEWEYQGSLNTARALKYPVDYFENLIYGDLNNDETINVLDIIIMVNIILNINESQDSADLNLDGFINVLDVIQLVNLILENSY